MFHVSPDLSGYDEIALDPYLNDHMTRVASYSLNEVPRNSSLLRSFNTNLLETKLIISASAISQLGNNNILEALTIYLLSSRLMFWNTCIICSFIWFCIEASSIFGCFNIKFLLLSSKLLIFALHTN